MQDLIILGGGLAAQAAGAYAAKLKIKTFIMPAGLEPRAFENEKELQENFKVLQGQHKEFLETGKAEKLLHLEKNIVSFSIELASGKVFYCQAVIIESFFPELEDLTLKDGRGKIKVNALMQTNIPGLFAIGEANNILSKDAFLAAAEGARAALSAEEFFRSKKKA